MVAESRSSKEVVSRLRPSTPKGGLEELRLEDHDSGNSPEPRPKNMELTIAAIEQLLRTKVTDPFSHFCSACVYRGPRVHKIMKELNTKLGTNIRHFKLISADGGSQFPSTVFYKGTLLDIVRQTRSGTS